MDAIISIIFFIIGAIFIGASKSTEITALGIIIIFTAGLLMGLFLNKPKIEPIDVYRGKTKLEIKMVMKDSVVISRDSTVVLK